MAFLSLRENHSWRFRQSLTKHPPFAFASVRLAAAPSQPKLAVSGGPTTQRAQAQVVFLSGAGQRYVLLQVRAEDLKSIERRAVLVVGQAIRAGMWSRSHGLR